MRRLHLSSRVLLLLGLVTACNRAPEKADAPHAEAVEKSIAPGDARAAETLRALCAVLDAALTAYNAGDRTALFADFATTATPLADDRIFAELYEGYYKSEFGRLTALRLYPAETVPDADFGLLVYLAQCERVPLAKVSANFIRENGAPKIVQLRIERVEPAAK